MFLANTCSTYFRLFSTLHFLLTTLSCPLEGRRVTLEVAWSYTQTSNHSCRHPRAFANRCVTDEYQKKTKTKIQHIVRPVGGMRIF